MLRLKLILLANLTILMVVNNVGGDGTMNLLNYTKTLYNMINKYDKILKATNFECVGNNPFCIETPLNLTVVWTEISDNKKKF
jgi:hypothetical protein